MSARAAISLQEDCGVLLVPAKEAAEMQLGSGETGWGRRCFLY